MTDGLSSLLGRAQRGAKRRRKEERRSARKDMLMAFGLQAFGAPIAKGVGDLINAPYRNPINSFLNDPEGRAVKGFGESLIRERDKVNQVMKSMDTWQNDGKGSKIDYIIQNHIEPAERRFLSNQGAIEDTDEAYQNFIRRGINVNNKENPNSWASDKIARATKELQELEEKYKWFNTLGSDDEIRASRKKYDPTPKGLLSSLGRFATRKFRGQTNEEYEENAMRNMLSNMGLGANDVNEYFADDGAGRKAFIKDLEEATKFVDSKTLEATINNRIKTNPHYENLIRRGKAELQLQQWFYGLTSPSSDNNTSLGRNARNWISKKDNKNKTPADFLAEISNQVGFGHSKLDLNNELRDELRLQARTQATSKDGKNTWRPIIQELEKGWAEANGKTLKLNEETGLYRRLPKEADQKAMDEHVDRTLDSLINQSYNQAAVFLAENGLDSNGNPNIAFMEKIYGSNFSTENLGDMRARQKELIYDIALGRASSPNGLEKVKSVTGIFSKKEQIFLSGLIEDRTPSTNRDLFEEDPEPQVVTTAPGALSQVAPDPADPNWKGIPYKKPDPVNQGTAGSGKGGPGTASGTSGINASANTPKNNLNKVKNSITKSKSTNIPTNLAMIEDFGKETMIHAATNPNDNPLTQQKGQSLRTPVKFKQGKANVTASFSATGQLNITRSGLSMADRKRSITYKEVAPHLNDAQKNQVLTMASALRMIEEEAAERFGSAEVLDDPTIFSTQEQADRKWAMPAIPSGLSKLLQERNAIAAKIDLPGLQDKQEVISFLQQSYGDLGAREGKMAGGEADVVAETSEPNKVPSMLARPEEPVNNQDETKDLESIAALIKQEEGDLDTVVSDEYVKNKKGKLVRKTEGATTFVAGYGHQMTAEDLKKYPPGSKVPKEQRELWFKEDLAKKYKAALAQKEQLPIKDKSLLERLTSVNFQLGTGWTKKFPKAWDAMTKGLWDVAANEIEDSKWAREQTTPRAKLFSSLLRTLEG